MRVPLRLALVMGLVALLPALPAAYYTRDLLGRALDVGLSPQMDAALEAGLRQTRSGLGALRGDAQRQLDSLGAELAALPREQWPDVFRQSLSATDELLLRLPGGESQALLERAAPAPPTAPVREGDPPTQLQLQTRLPDGSRLELSRSLGEGWREDAQRIAGGLQMVRALDVDRPHLERSFWAPFLVIYSMALVLALLTAWFVSRGLTAPLGRLVHATRRVAKGDWDAQVVDDRRDELGELSTSFNEMVRTLRAQNRRIVDLQTMEGWREMARALAHEVKNPLTPIQLTVEEMRARYTGDDSEYERLLDECSRIVVEEVDSLRRVVMRFREFSRPVELRLAPVDLNELVRDVAALQRDLSPSFELEEALAPMMADADRLRQLLLNLAENARQAQKETPSPRLLLRTRLLGDEVELTVEDAGPGIAEEQRSRVFEPYHSGTVGGLGLGLSLVKGIVVAHGGSIEVAEGSLGGAAFCMRLPHRKEEVISS